MKRPETIPVREWAGIDERSGRLPFGGDIMGFWDLFKRVDINEGVETWRNTKGAVLLDVRTPEEYRSGHVPGSINLPVGNILEAEKEFPDKSTPIFTYCLSGMRSNSAVSALKQRGYQSVTSIGGINRYRGDMEKS